MIDQLVMDTNSSLCCMAYTVPNPRGAALKVEGLYKLYGMGLPCYHSRSLLDAADL